MSVPPEFEVYVEALRTHAERGVQLNTSVLNLVIVVEAVQLGLMHPWYPHYLRSALEEWVHLTIAALRTLSPPIAAMLEAGYRPDWLRPYADNDDA